MEVRQPHIGDERTLAVHLHTQYAGELQDVVSRHLPMLYRRAYRYVGDPQDAEDAVQDALLSAYRHLDQFKGTAKMTTWLTTIVTNSALTQLRRRPRHSHVSLEERIGEDQDFCVSDGLADVGPSPEGECIELERHENLIQYVMELTPALRKAIEMCVLEGLTSREVAQRLGVPHGTVKARVSRARTILKQRMNRR